MATNREMDQLSKWADGLVTETQRLQGIEQRAEQAEQRARDHHKEPCETCIACETERNDAEAEFERMKHELTVWTSAARVNANAATVSRLDQQQAEAKLAAAHQVLEVFADDLDSGPSTRLLATELRNRWRAALAAVRDQTTQDTDRRYPCDKCGVLRTKTEGGTTFTVCDACWDERAERDAQENRPEGALDAREKESR